MRYSEIFNISAEELESKGVFDADVDSDSQLHIDPALFKGCKIPEFVGAYDEFNEYFAKIFVGIVPYAKSNPRFYNALVKRLSFREIANTCLGYSKSGTKGSGIGGKLSQQVANSIIEIYDLGIKNPVVFEMMSFFEEGIGADRISDMTAYLLIGRLLEFTIRVCNELGIPTSPRIRYNSKLYNVPTYKNRSFVFVPAEVLCDLPTAYSYDDIDSVCHYNEMFRRRICQEIGEKWKDFKDAPKWKIKKFLFDNPDVFQEFVDEWERTSHRPYNYIKDKKHVMGRCFSATIKGRAGNQYVKIVFDNPAQAESALPILMASPKLLDVSFTEDSGTDTLDTLTVVGIPIYDVSEIEKDVNHRLLNFFLKRVILQENVVNIPTFANIKTQIIEELNKAINFIYVCVAWFTDEELRDILEAKRQAGVDVRVITFKDGVNKTHGVDFGDIQHKEMRGEHGGLMHRKYAVIDNHVTITGSFNWTENAANHNSENIVIMQDWNNANQCTRQFLNDWNQQ